VSFVGCSGPKQFVAAPTWRRTVRTERGGLHVTVTHLVSGELVSQRDWVRVGLLVVCRSRSLHLADSFVFSHVFVFSHFSGGWADDERTPTTDRTAEQKL
jgi:hypothetical protein